jgi:hypothetical protein
MTFWYKNQKHNSFQKGISMTSRILQELMTDKSYQDLPLPILQEIYPRELLCEALSQTGRWEKRERKIPHVFLIYALFCLDAFALSGTQTRLWTVEQWPALVCTREAQHTADCFCPLLPSPDFGRQSIELVDATGMSAALPTGHSRSFSLWSSLGRH